MARQAPVAITGSSDHLAKLWDLNSGKMLRSWDHPFKVYKVTLSDDGALTMTNASMNKTRIWDTASGALLHILPMRYMTVTAAAFTQDKQYLATGRPNYRVDLWDLKTGELKRMWSPEKKHFWRPDSAAVIDLTFEAGEKTILSEASNGIAHRWRIP
jgi:WD40 repeat protein